MRRSTGGPLIAEIMLFFFELFLFVLVMLTLALGEFVSRGLALTLWLVVTVVTLVGYVIARQSLKPLLADGTVALTGSAPGEALPPTVNESPAASGPEPAAETADAAQPDGHEQDVQADADAPTPLDERWARTLLYNWRRANVLLILGAAVTGGWYWLGLRG